MLDVRIFALEVRLEYVLYIDYSLVTLDYYVTAIENATMIDPLRD